MMNIRMFESPQDRTFRYEISNGKNSLLREKGLPDRETCLNNIKRTLLFLFNNDMINVSSVGGAYIFSAGKAESRRFKSIEEASDAIAFLKEAGQKNKGSFKVHFEGKAAAVISNRKIGTDNEGYDFTQVSQTKKVGFELLDKEKERLFYFRLNDKEGKPMLFSRAYDGKRQRIKAARNMISLVENNKKTPVSIIPRQGKFIFIIKDLEGYEIARSKPYKSEEAAKVGINFLKGRAKEKVKILKLPKKKKKKPNKLPKEKFLLKQLSPKGFVGFEAFRSAQNKCHYFHYHDRKGEVLLYSSAFLSRKGRDAMIQESIQLSENKERYVMKEKKGKHFFTIVTDKGKAIARSRYFDTKRDMILKMRHFLENAGKYTNKENTITSKKVEIIPIKLKGGKPAKDNSIPVTEKPTATQKLIVPNPSKKLEPNNNTRNKKPIVENKNAKHPYNRQPKKEPIHPKKDNRPASAKPPRSKNHNTKKETAKGYNSKKLPALKETTPTKRSSTKIAQPPVPTIQRKRIDDSEIQEESSLLKWWWVPLLLLGLLYFLRQCGGNDTFLQEETPIVKEEPPKNIKPVKETTPVKKLPTLLGPNGTKLGFSQGSTASKIANFLSLPNSVFPKTFLLDQVHFNTNQDLLEASAFGQLDKVVTILKAYPTAQVQINGHTDSSGNLERNLQLSNDRATTVQKYLGSKGVATNRITAKGFGASQPFSTNQTAQGKYKNRRSEIVLLRR